MCAMTTSGYIGEGSPDRVDAAVWALDELMGLSGPEDFAPLLDAWVSKPAGPAPILPGHEQRVALPDSGDLMDDYARAFGLRAPKPPACQRCGAAIGASRQTDGVDFWCIGCR